MISGSNQDNWANGADTQVQIGFALHSISLFVDAIVPLRKLRNGIEESRKYAQIACSIKAIGLVEAPVVAADPSNEGQYLLLDGHIRIAILKDIGVTSVDCLVATDDEAYTYNKRINRLPPVQEHRMIVKAIERGVTESAIADALGLDVMSIRARFRLLNGICPEAAEMLKDTNCSMKVFDILRRMSAMRQIEAADLMIGQNNFTLIFGRALLAATSHDQMALKAKKARKTDLSGPTSQHIARMERELATLQTQVRSVEESYGIDNLHLTFARGYIAKLIGNAGIVRWLSHHKPEYLAEFQRIIAIDSIGNLTGPFADPVVDGDPDPLSAGTMGDAAQ